ncbi:ABC transporter ATP-binding protein [Clavibacter sp. VKM Ac-2873]|uniref:ATP-binding cassette domain-containing protein n=1 Tax=Clavibacter sp. VKM Ac-2873 TaxID=2783813 RepID=UPI00188B5C33|nr:ABC transporter ATP-binding protein [Clavibacter sp. VKM Ac-2873]MBF4618553.1 ABC transporter ATP-binding protein [Clavibacter sp. VKM Ac-2873]
MPIITLTGVTKVFRGNTLFQGVDLALERGRTYGLVGPNGCGKSVLFKLICGFMRPDSGVIDIDPDLLSPGRTFPDRFGAIIDGPAYLAHRTGLQNLTELAAIRKRITVDEVRDAMRAMGLDPDSRTRVRSYSLGMKQKLSLVQALMERPEVLLLDEPFNALDAESVERLTAELRRQQGLGTTILFTSHEREHIDALSHEVLEITGGRIRNTTRP